jgi:hypothetical protein
MNLRAKMIHVPASFFLSLMNVDVFIEEHSSLDNLNILQLRFEGLPQDCRIHDVHWNYNTRCWGIIVTHESFDIVRDGHLIPAIEGITKVARIEKKLEGWQLSKEDES